MAFPESPFSDIIETKSLPLGVKCQKLCVKSDEKSSLTIYKLSTTTTMKDPSKKIAKVTFGRESCPPKPTKVLMVMGATGAGKSTLINGMTNYLLGTEFSSNFRFKLIVDEDGKSKTENRESKISQAHSQTEWITTYTFYWQEGFPVPYNLTIIDTPGFGDTKGPEKDRKITEQVKDLFSIQGKDGIDQLHGIGFVTQASLPRLTITQQYIFDSVLAIFGKDIKNNIFIMTAFTDRPEPQVLEAVKAAKIPYCAFFPFNNSALFAQQTGKFTQMFWDMDYASFTDFFIHFEKARSVSLQLTHEVLRECQQLECVFSDLQLQINMGLSKMDELQQEIILKRKESERKESEVLSNNDFTYKVKVPKVRQIDIKGTGRYAINCRHCNYTCHDNCEYINDEDMHKCSAMDGGGKSNAKCKVCPGRCHWKYHVSDSYYFDVYEEIETRTSQDLRERYEKAISKKANVEGMVSKMQKQLDDHSQLILSKIRQACQCLQRLSEIALKPNPLTEVEYIDLLIESEKSEKKPGWQHRIQHFQKIREQADIMTKMKTEQEIEKMLAGKENTKRWWQIWRN